MAGPFGISFAPGAPQGATPGRMGGQPNQRLQEAVRILSLRLPKAYGSRAIAPAPLLNAPGAMGQAGMRGNVSAQALAQLSGMPAQSYGNDVRMGEAGGPPSPAQMPLPPPPMGLPAGPVLGGGGTDSYGGWQQQERTLSRPRPGGMPMPPMPAPPSPQGPPGSPMLPMSSGQDAALPPMSFGPPRIIPGQETGEGSGPPFRPPEPWVDPRPILPLPSPAPSGREELFDQPEPAMGPPSGGDDQIGALLELLNRFRTREANPTD